MHELCGCIFHLSRAGINPNKDPDVEVDAQREQLQAQGRLSAPPSYLFISLPPL